MRGPWPYLLFLSVWEHKAYCATHVHTRTPPLRVKKPDSSSHNSQHQGEEVRVIIILKKQGTLTLINTHIYTITQAHFALLPVCGSAASPFSRSVCSFLQQLSRAVVSSLPSHNRQQKQNFTEF